MGDADSVNKGVRWFALPIAVSGAFVASGCTGFFIAKWIGLRQDCLAGFFAARAAAITAYCAAPHARLSVAFSVSLIGAWVMWMFLESDFGALAGRPVDVESVEATHE